VLVNVCARSAGYDEPVKKTHSKLRPIRVLDVKSLDRVQGAGRERLRKIAVASGDSTDPTSGSTESA
jgi:hypothetical protein